MGSERRKFPRIPAAIAIAYRTVYLTEPNPTLTRDISEGGLRFFTIAPLDSGTTLKMTIQLSGRPQPIRLTAEVLWSRLVTPPSKEPGALPYETAVIFTDATAADRQALATLVASRK